MFNFDKNKILIVGAGLAGCTIARILAENSFKVEIIDKRNHIAGNIFDYVNVETKTKKLLDIFKILQINLDKEQDQTIRKVITS